MFPLNLGTVTRFLSWGRPQRCKYLTNFQITYHECKEKCRWWNRNAPLGYYGPPCAGFETTAQDTFNQTTGQCNLIRSVRNAGLDLQCPQIDSWELLSTNICGHGDYTVPNASFICRFRPGVSGCDPSLPQFRCFAMFDAAHFGGCPLIPDCPT